MIKDILIEIINHLSPIAMIPFSLTCKTNYELCNLNMNYQLFTQNRSTISCGSNYTMFIDKDLYMSGVKSTGEMVDNKDYLYIPTLIHKKVISVHAAERYFIFMTKDFVYCVNEQQLYKVCDSYHVLFISAGYNRTFIVTRQGLYGCGANFHGELMLSDRYYKSPTLIPFNHQILQIACGYRHTIIRTKYQFYGYGLNTSFQINNLNLNEETMKVSCGLTHTILLTHKNVYGLGNNASGQLGLGLIHLVTEPTKINLENVIDICCGGDYTLFLSDELYVSGSAFYGLGLGNNTNCHIPVKLNLNVLSMACGENHTIIYNGDYYGFGNNRYSQLGLGKYKKKKYNKPQLIKFK